VHLLYAFYCSKLIPGVFGPYKTIINTLLCMAMGQMLSNLFKVPKTLKTGQGSEPCKDETQVPMLSHHYVEDFIYTTYQCIKYIG
jgi:hypothetical protein